MYHCPCNTEKPPDRCTQLNKAMNSSCKSPYGSFLKKFFLQQGRVQGHPIPHPGPCNLLCCTLSVWQRTDLQLSACSCDGRLWRVKPPNIPFHCADWWLIQAAMSPCKQTNGFRLAQKISARKEVKKKKKKKERSLPTTSLLTLIPSKSLWLYRKK